MTLIDSHTHLYSKEFEDDIDVLLKTAIDAGISKFMLPNIDSEWIDAMLALTDKHPDNCFPMMGLHPCSVKANYKDELKVAERLLGEKKFYAIGEMGIDLYWDKSFIKEQDNAFEIQCKWAAELNLPVVIHSRDATDHAIQLLRKLSLPGLKGVFHCFTGSIEQANEIIEMGFLLGIGGVATYKNGGLDKVLPGIALEHIILETDAPYLAPVPHRGKRNEPVYLKVIAERVASIYNTSLEETASTTTKNAQILFNL